MTFTLRARLAVIATIVSGLLLGGLSVVSYNVLARWLDLEERCDVHAHALLAAEAEVARLRRMLSSGNNDVTPEEFARRNRERHRN